MERVYQIFPHNSSIFQKYIAFYLNHARMTLAKQWCFVESQKLLYQNLPVRADGDEYNE